MIRKLPPLTQSVTIGGVLSNHKVVYTYNADGMITGVRHYYYNDYYYDSEYIVDGTRVLAYQGGDDRGSFYAEYLYDESGSPIGMRYYAYNFETNQRETECVYYFFEKNIFGDIVGVYDEEGDKVLGFTYDAWGNVSITESSEISSLYEGYATYLKKACIFRYRGYMYESSSGFYYLQTRFYDPAVGRFINADGYINGNGDLLGFNMYAYCGNNPVMFTDPTGQWTFTLGLSANISLAGGGYSIGIGISVDSNGMLALQWTYSVPANEETRNTALGLGAGAGVSFQYTNKDSVEDLNGKFKYVGANTPVAGGNAILDENNDLVGGEVNLGASVGGDIHVNETNTKTIGSPFKSLIDIFKEWLGIE